jgi:hypothetical protein
VAVVAVVEAVEVEVAGARPAVAAVEVEVAAEVEEAGVMRH